MRSRAFRLGRCLLSLSLALGLLSPAAHARLMTVDDYLKMQTLGAVEVSSGSDLVAVLISRPSEEGDNFRVPTLSELRIPLRNDLLVISATDGRVVFRVEGRSDGGSVLLSRWSPDGGKLAYLRADRAGRVSLMIWNAASGQERTLVEGVRPFFPYIRRAGADAPADAIAWMNNEQIMFTQAGDSLVVAAAHPDRAAERAAIGGQSARVWKTRAVPMCRPEDRLAIVNVSDGAIEEVAEGAILGASISPDRSSILVVKGIEHLPPPKTDPLPASLRMARAPDSTPFVRWEVSLLSHRNGAWETVGASATGTGAVTPETLPRWQPDGRAWAMLQEPNPFALEPTTEVSRFEVRNRWVSKNSNRWVSKNSFGSHREGRDALAAVERGKRAALAASRRTVPAALAARIGADARFIGETRSKSRIFQSHANHGAVLWAINGDRAIELAKVNEHLRDVGPPQPLPVRYSANGEERTGWLHLPPGVEGPVPVVVTAYPLTMGLPPQFALSPEGTFPVLYELLARGIGVYVSDLRIQMPGPSVDEPVQRILSEMDASIEALKATGKVEGDKIGFFGHSFGGYTAVTLLAHTSYFRGIVAAAPLGDLLSYAFSAQRYHFDESCAPAQVLTRQMAHEYPGGPELPPVNNLLMKMGGPPYALRDKYLRNSPLLNMKEATTPALIIQGSEDGFSDGERILNTLYRLGVDAELLYYWGEGHIVYSPANVRHMTERTAEWLIEHLNGPAQKVSSTQ